MQTQAIHCTWPGLLATVISDPEAHTQIELSEELTLLVPGLQAEVTEHPLTEMTKSRWSLNYYCQFSFSVPTSII